VRRPDAGREARDQREFSAVDSVAELE
jgi:hypothetical protein